MVGLRRCRCARRFLLVCGISFLQSSSFVLSNAEGDVSSDVFTVTEEKCVVNGDKWLGTNAKLTTEIVHVMKGDLLMVEATNENRMPFSILPSFKVRTKQYKYQSRDATMWS